MLDVVRCLSIIHFTKLVKLNESPFLSDNTHDVTITLVDWQVLFLALNVYPLKCIEVDRDKRIQNLVYLSTVFNATVTVVTVVK